MKRGEYMSGKLKIKTDDFSKDNYVVKANKFIEAKGKLGMLEQKLMATLISEIQMEDKDFKEYCLNIKEVGEFIGLDSKEVYRKLREIAQSLKSRSISLEEINVKTKEITFIEVNLIASAVHTKGSGILRLTIAPVLKPYLLAIKGEETPFTKYMIRNILKLNSGYSIRIYELLKQYERTQNRIIETEKLKELLGVTEKSYNRFDNFEARVLKPAKEEINKKTDIWINYEKIKKGRRIAEIHFTIQSKKVDEEQQLLETLITPEEMKAIRDKCGFTDVKFSDKQVMQCYEIAIDISDKFSSKGIDIVPYEYVKLSYEYVLNQKGVKNKFAYFKKTLEGDFGGAVMKIVMGY